MGVIGAAPSRIRPLLIGDLGGLEYGGFGGFTVWLFSRSSREVFKYGRRWVLVVIMASLSFCFGWGHSFYPVSGTPQSCLDNLQLPVCFDQNCFASVFLRVGRV